MNKNKVRNKLKTTKGITLIALVIMIIVLLILAAVSIATLTGENGILSKANNSKIETEKASAKEKVQMAVMSSFDNSGKLDYTQLKTNLDKVEGIDKETVPSTITKDTFLFTVKVDGYDVTIDENGKVTVAGENSDSQDNLTPNLPSTEDTKPYLPDENSTIISNNPETGIIVKDSNNNEWVWIEVPKSIYTNTTYNGGTVPTSSEDYAKIESTMQAYASVYRGGGTDTFYSTAQHGFADETEYNNWKNSMLKSVYENGGFYIGRYQVELKTDSSGWGNYENVSFDIKREQGLYTTSPTTSGSWNTTSNYTKPSSGGLLTTGATDRNSTLGIYDLAGNVFEWTLEYSTGINNPCVLRGGYYDYGGSNYPASYRYSIGTAYTDDDTGARSALW